jgi:hypothetical protein
MRASNRLQRPVQGLSAIQPLAISEASPPPKTTGPTARPGALVSAAPPVALPRDPRTSPGHPTWWTKTKILTRKPPNGGAVTDLNLGWFVIFFVLVLGDGL